MNSLFRKMGAWLKQAWVWTLSCVLCAGLLVWFIGPLLAVDDYKFWASPTARLLTISTLLLGWGLGMVWFTERTGAAKRAGKADASTPDIPDQTRIDQERSELRSGFKRALRTVKTSSLYSGRGRRGRDELPWYLLMGPTGSGKTSLLHCSGVEFPLNGLEQTPSGEASGLGDCQWYFAEQAVLIDTAGHYLAQTDTGAGASAWDFLLESLRRCRRNRPLSGVLVTVPVEVLRMGSEDDVVKLACQIRGRLQALQRQLRADVPVHLVLSKADSLPGFNEFFDSLTPQECEQVLGMCFSPEQRGNDVATLRAEFEALLHRLNRQLLTRLHQERDMARRGQILGFPQQLAQITSHLGLLVELVFSGQACPLRGVYLTRVSPARLTVQGPGPDYATSLRGQATPSSRGGRNGRFIHQLLTRAIFSEADMTAFDQRERRRLDWRQRVMSVGALMTLGLFGLLWTSGFSANHERLEHLRALAQRWDQQHFSQALSDDSTMLESLDIRFEATQAFPPASAVPLYERIGLYQGAVSNPAVNAAYERELVSELLPRVAQMLEGGIHGSLNEREQLLNSLRAYLMLAQPERRDTAWLRARVASDWSLRHPANTALQSGLNAHFERLLSQPFVQVLDESLVAQARETLRSESLATVVYRMLREQASHLAQYRLSQHLGPQGGLLTGTDHVIPGFYTREGYRQYFSAQGMTLITGLLRDNWVLGEGASLSGMDLRRLRIELEQMYFSDYADLWAAAVGQVALQPIHGTDEAAELLTGLTSAHSPILQLLVQVREHTRIPGVAERLSEATPAIGATRQLAAIAENVSESGISNLPDTGLKSLQRRFEPLHRLLDPDNGPAADLTLALRALDDAQLQLASLARAGAPEQAAFELAKQRMGGQRDALGNLRSASARLPRPVGNWFGAVADDSWRLVLGDSYRYLNQRYQSELYGFYRKAINKRYPFSAHSASDVAINDFQEFFKDQGLIDRFFENYMRPFVTGQPGHYRLRSVDGQSLPMSKNYLDQMATAHTIRQGFFMDNPGEPRVQFKLEPYTLDPAVSRSEFRYGDKTLEYRHGPIQPMALTWPVEAQDGRTSLVLDRMAGGRGVGIEKNTGPWSLFRLLDLMETQYLTGRDVRVLKADLGGLRANYLLTSQRTPNPFDMTALRAFRLPVQL